MPNSHLLNVSKVAFGLGNTNTNGCEDDAAAMMGALSLFRWATPASRHWWDSQAIRFMGQNQQNLWFWHLLRQARLEAFGPGGTLNGDAKDFGHYPWALSDAEFTAAYKSINNGTDPGLGNGDLRVANILNTVGTIAGVAGGVFKLVGPPQVAATLAVISSSTKGASAAIKWLHKTANTANLVVLKGMYDADVRRRASFA
jgi:hypothetical protein